MSPGWTATLMVAGVGAFALVGIFTLGNVGHHLLQACQDPDEFPSLREQTMKEKAWARRKLKFWAPLALLEILVLMATVASCIDGQQVAG